MKKSLFFLSVLFVSLLFAANVMAYSVSYDAGTTYNTQALTDYSTYGDQMDGMTVQANFTDGSSQTQIWSDTASNSGGVSGTNWSLSLAGDTFGSGWPLMLWLDDINLASLFIDAGTGDTVFDVMNDYSDFGSPNSANGRPFHTTSSADIAATYSDRVMVDNTFYGDLYRTLSLDFGPNGLSTGFTFYADTDSLQYAGDINPVNPVPEPATLLLTGTGVLGLVFMRKRLKFKA